MGRLLEIDSAQALPASVTLAVGDVLKVGVTGGNLQSRPDVVEILGPFVPGVLVDGAKIVSPMGAPGTIMVLARRPGRTVIDFATGDPWGAPGTKRVEIRVEP